MDRIAKQKLLVPVIGSISADKTSLLNSQLGQDKDALPVDITPETSLAAELRYGSQRIEAVDQNGGVEQYALDDFGEVKKKATQYQNLRVYLKTDPGAVSECAFGGVSECAL